MVITRFAHLSSLDEVDGRRIRSRRRRSMRGGDSDADATTQDYQLYEVDEPLLSARALPTQSGSRTVVAFSIAGVLLGSTFLFGFLATPLAPALMPTTILVASAGTCPTLPYGKCAGMNYSHSPPMFELCCPSSTTCVKYSPWFGMCESSERPLPLSMRTRAVACRHCTMYICIARPK